MVQKRKIIELDDFEHRVLMGVLAEHRNEMLTKQKNTEDINDLLHKIIDAPIKKRKVQNERSER